MRFALSLLMLLAVPAVAQSTEPTCHASDQPGWATASAEQKAAMLRGCHPDATVRATHVEKVFNRPLAIGGAVILGASYSVLAVPLAFSDAVLHFGPDVRGAYVPVAGPLFLVGSQNGDPGRIAFLIIDAVVQGAGLAMLVASPFVPREVEVPNEGLSWTVTPTAGPSSVGAQLVIRGF